ncbi:MAG: hypothetical protein AAGJ17_00315 [Pseudomonadota bacterium]
MANDEDRPVTEFISTYYQVMNKHHGSLKNLASILRVTCLIDALNNK